MIWTLLAVALLSTFGSIFGEPPATDTYLRATAAAAVAVVTDEDKADELEAYFEDIEEQVEEDRAELERLRRAFFAVDRRYDATLEDYERVFTDLEQFWERSARRGIAIAVAMRAEMTAEQWRQVVEARRPAADALLAELHGAR
ncbi:MAG: hypothetical protein ACYTGX_03415 [Planctomycetota bacterium]